MTEQEFRTKADELYSEFVQKGYQIKVSHRPLHIVMWTSVVFFLAVIGTAIYFMTVANYKAGLIILIPTLVGSAIVCLMVWREYGEYNALMSKNLKEFNKKMEHLDIEFRASRGGYRYEESESSNGEE